MFRFESHSLVGESSSLRVEFDRTTGSLTQLTNKQTGQELCATGTTVPPWRLIGQGTIPSAFPPVGPSMGFRFSEIDSAKFSAELDEDEANLTWDTSTAGVIVHVRLEITTSGNLQMWPSITVPTGVPPPAHFVFPLITPTELSRSDRLLFPAHSGWLISDPLTEASEGVYPDGYHGLSVQLMGYFAQGTGGFYMACHDPHVTHKKFTFSEHEMSIRHDTWDLREGMDIDFDYPVVVSTMDRGHWFEAAAEYREWAKKAPWSHKGPNVERSGHDRPSWLFDEVGLSLWGTPSSLDWSDRYRILASLVGTPLHIVSGWDWPATRPHYVGKEGWFPANFHPANLEVWEDHYVTPYLNDLFISSRAPDFIEEWEPNLIFPYQTFSFTVFSERRPDYVRGTGSPGDPNLMTDVDFYVCPCTEAQRELHSWRDRRLVDDYGLAGVFYDISSGNPFAARCLRISHGHAPGWSREVLQGYAANNAASRNAMRAATGQIPAQGVETIVEHVIADIDFYVARSVAGPIGGLEALTLGRETPPGEGRELVPLFQAIYHSIGPVHEDGWLTLAGANGDIFYWIVARLTIVWGGLLSLHYANNPPEHFDGAGQAEIISWDGGHHVFEDLEPVDSGFVEFTKAMGKLRVGPGNPYLAYGEMLCPLELELPRISLGYHRSNALMTGVFRAGEWSVPAAVHGAWQGPDGSIAQFLVNISDDALPVTTQVEPDWPIEDAFCRVRGAEGSATLDGGRLAIDVVLPPRSPVMIEMVPNQPD